MTVPLHLSHPALRGDSRADRMISRAGPVEAVFGRVGALVVSAAHARPVSGDRTLLRSLAALLALVLAPVWRAASWVRQSVRPESAWTITRRAATSHPASAPMRTRGGQAIHLLPHRAAAPESPASVARAIHDETRDSHQRDPARNAGRHPRGRRAR